MSFSIEGADNLARVIAMVGSYDYEGIGKAFEIQVLPQKAIDEAEEYIKNIEKNIISGSGIQGSEMEQMHLLLSFH